MRKTNTTQPDDYDALLRWYQLLQMRRQLDNDTRLHLETRRLIEREIEDQSAALLIILERQAERRRAAPA